MFPNFPEFVLNILKVFVITSLFSRYRLEHRTCFKSQLGRCKTTSFSVTSNVINTINLMP